MTRPEQQSGGQVSKLRAEWTHDCSGKQDYDADLVQLSTRYWPRGGGFLELRAGGGFIGNEGRPEIRPAAKASILIQGEAIYSAEFEGDTEGDVKAQVERWAADQWSRIHAAIAKAVSP